MNFVLSPEDRDWLLDVSESKGQSMSEIVRGLIASRREKARQRALAGLEKIAGIAKAKGVNGRDNDAILYGRKKR